MFIIVVGSGKIGYYLTRELLSAGHEVVVVERDAGRADAARDEFGGIVITSDGTEPTVLGEAGAARCDILIASTGADAVNLMACQVGRWAYNVPRTIAVVTDPANVPLFKTLGVDVTISTTELILATMEEGLSGGPLVHVLQLHGISPSGASAGIVCVRIPPGSPVVGRTPSEVALPAGTVLAAVVSREGELRSLGECPPLEAHDEVVAITPPDREGALWQALTGGA